MKNIYLDNIKIKSAKYAIAERYPDIIYVGVLSYKKQTNNPMSWKLDYKTSIGQGSGLPGLWTRESILCFSSLEEAQEKQKELLIEKQLREEATKKIEEDKKNKEELLDRQHSLKKNIFNKYKDAKEFSRYAHPSLYYYPLTNGDMKVVGISLDCGYLADYGGCEPNIESTLDILYQNGINIDEENIGNGDEDEDFYELVEPIVINKKQIGRNSLPII